MCEPVAKFSITAVCGCGSDGVCGIKILNSQCNILGTFGILTEILNHEFCEVEVLLITTLINLILLYTELLPDNFSVVIDEAFLGTFGYDDYAVAFG